MCTRRGRGIMSIMSAFGHLWALIFVDGDSYWILCWHGADREHVHDQVSDLGAAGRSSRSAVKADALTAAPQHAVDDATQDAIRAAVFRLARCGEIRSGSGPGPVHYT